MEATSPVGHSSEDEGSECVCGIELLKKRNVCVDKKHGDTKSSQTLTKKL